MSIPTMQTKPIWPNRPVLSQQRDNTDTALHAERIKTDLGVLQRRKIEERTADRIVGLARATADAVLLQARNDADTLLDVTEALTRNRSLDDSTIQCTRATADEMMRNLRMKHSSEHWLRERKNTDIYLVAERVHSDASKENLEAFVRSIVHDVKSPLRTMVGLSQLIMQKVPHEADPCIKEFASLIVEQGKQLTSMIETLLDVSHAGFITADKIKHVSMRSVLDTALVGLRAELVRRDVQLEIGEMPDLDAVPDLLVGVWQNLIENAVKYQTGPQPYVGIFAKPSDAGGWNFEVVDHGPGIAPESHEQIFQLFQRGTAATAVEGSGVGLSLVRRTVNSLGGSVWVESALGHGAKFIFFIPDKLNCPVVPLLTPGRSLD